MTERFIHGFRYDGEHRTLTVSIAGVEVGESIDLVNRISNHMSTKRDDQRLVDAMRPSGTPMSEDRRRIEDEAAASGMEVTHAAKAVPVAVPKGEGPEGVQVETIDQQAARLSALGKYEVPADAEGKSPGELPVKTVKPNVGEGYVAVGLEGGWWVKLGPGDKVLAVQGPKPKSEAKPDTKVEAKEEPKEEKPKSKKADKAPEPAEPTKDLPDSITDELVEELRAMDAIRAVISTLHSKAGVGKADMLGVCQALSARVPVIAKTQNLGDRVPRLLNVLGINS